MTYSAADRVYADVKELILTCELPGGELISEGEIAERCEVSRTPVREAFLRLAAEGWMRLYPKRGALVVPVGDQEARDVLEARVLVESHAIRSVVGMPSTLAALGARLDENRRAHQAVDPSDAAEFARLDAQFHQMIVAADGNALLGDFYSSLGERQRRMTAARLHLGREVVDRIHHDHTALAAAIADGDADGFAGLLAAHLAGVHDVDGGVR
ncbi:GntR family transcriptional regulator [Gordonia liuliyuniae]|uniref:GntR family transcriptional regulator n=1 Tax=Gordonia liuliyuniae TaxID=2911517 RepID=A0ABS9ISY5_9ACTN|nr:GntR family transcriptional regulator [Gordonia liuliyuniae]MCF8588664.1 GntR family transcriptional regulator [Gordonia liuliyuniae]